MRTRPKPEGFLGVVCHRVEMGTGITIKKVVGLCDPPRGVDLIADDDIVYIGYLFICAWQSLCRVI